MERRKEDAAAKNIDEEWTATPLEGLFFLRLRIFNVQSRSFLCRNCLKLLT